MQVPVQNFVVSTKSEKPDGMLPTEQIDVLLLNSWNQLKRREC